MGAGQTKSLSTQWTAGRENTLKIGVNLQVCKKKGHALKECRLRQYVNSKKTTKQIRNLKRKSKFGKRETIEHKLRTFYSSNSESCLELTMAALKFSAKLIKNLTFLEIDQCIQGKIELIVDTGINANMIKFSKLRKEILINEKII